MKITAIGAIMGKLSDSIIGQSRKAIITTFHMAVLNGDTGIVQGMLTDDRYKQELSKVLPLVQRRAIGIIGLSVGKLGFDSNLTPAEHALRLAATRGNDAMIKILLEAFPQRERAIRYAIYDAILHGNFNTDRIPNDDAQDAPNYDQVIRRLVNAGNIDVQVLSGLERQSPEVVAVIRRNLARFDAQNEQLQEITNY